MDKRFEKSPTGRLIKTSHGADAFTPNPLPPRINAARHISSVVEAASALGELNGAARRLANPQILLRPLRNREALTSSAIEGTHSTAEDLALLDAGDIGEVRNETREVRNYAIALNNSMNHIEECGAITQFLIRSIHRQLMANLPDSNSAVRPGEYKVEQNYIGGKRGQIQTARFVPPPPLETKLCMDDLENYLASDHSEKPHPLIDAALVHYQFETIHPFSDGNGRVGRILIPLLLKKNKVPGAHLLYVSPAIESRKDDYIDLMFAVSRDGDWDSWIDFFLGVITISAHSAIDVVDRLIALQERYARIARESSQSSNLRTLVDMLFTTPVVTIPNVRDFIGVTYRAAAGLVEKLVEARILFEAPNRPIKTFIAPEIILIARDEDSQRL